MLLKVIVACLIVLLLSCGEEVTEEEAKVRAEAVAGRAMTWGMIAAFCQDERAQKAMDEFEESMDKGDSIEYAEWDDLSHHEKVEVIEVLEALEDGVDKLAQAVEDAECN